MHWRFGGALDNPHGLHMDCSRHTYTAFKPPHMLLQTCLTIFRVWGLALVLPSSQGNSRLPRLAAKELFGMTLVHQKVMSEVLEAPMVGQVVA